MMKYQDAIVNSQGLPVPSASVLVRPTGGTSTSSIYSDSGTSSKANPITADANGRFSFYAANGRYDLVVSGATIQTTTVTDVMLEDVPLSNLSELTTASAARSNLGLGSAAVVSTSSFLQSANNLSDLSSTASARVNLGLGTSTGTVLAAANNLADVASAATARANLGVAIGTNVQAFSTAFLLTTGSQSYAGGKTATVVSLASTGQITPDLSAGNNFQLSMTVNTTLAKGTNATAGQEFRITVFQNSTAKTLAYDSSFYKFAGGSTATLSTATGVGTTDVLRGYMITSTSAECEMRNLVQ